MSEVLLYWKIRHSRAKREHLQSFEAVLPESQGQGQILTLTVLFLPHSLDSGTQKRPCVYIVILLFGPYQIEHHTNTALSRA